MAFIIPLIGAAVSAVGTIASGAAAKTAAEAQSNALQFRATQEEMAATEARAASQRQADEKRHEGLLVRSQLQARAAASGGSATDPGILAIDSSIVGRSEYLALTETYKGENRARGLEGTAMATRMSADAALAEGKAKQTASYFSGAGTLIGGIGSAYSAYSGVPTSRPLAGYG